MPVDRGSRDSPREVGGGRSSRKKPIGLPLIIREAGPVLVSTGRPPALGVSRVRGERRQVEPILLGKGEKTSVGLLVK